MQVQRIQLTEPIQKPNFRAKFVYDRAGNFRNLWETSSKSSEFNAVAEKFSKIKNGVLEIMKVTAKGGGNNYKIFNHSTKKEKNIAIFHDRGCHKIENLISKLTEDMDFFIKNDNQVSKMVHRAVPTFLKDDNGYFEVLWANSQKSHEYENKLPKFLGCTESGSLEVYDMNKFTGGVQEIFDKTGSKIGSEQCREYDIINRKTGAYNHYIIPEKVEYKLEYLLDQIMADKWIREPFDNTEGYRNLLGLK